jgi:hypothetical protein
MALFDALAQALNTYGSEQLAHRMEVRAELERVVSAEGHPYARIDPDVLNFLAPLKPINPASDD